MRLFLYSDLMQTCDDLCRAIHLLERGVQWVRCWAWIRSTKLNLSTLNTRKVGRRSLFS